MKTKIFIVGVVTLFMAMPATAQNETYQHWSIVLNGGVTGYVPTGGSLKKDLGPTFGLGVEWTANPYWGISLDYQYLSFKNGSIDEFGYLNEVALSGQLNLANLAAKDRRGGWQKLNLYAHLGLGLSWDMHAGPSGKGRNICGVIPAGFMLEYNITPLLALNLNLEGRWHTARTRDVAYNPTGVINALATAGLRVKLGTRNHARNVVPQERPIAPVYANNDALVKQLQGQLDDNIAKSNKAFDDANNKLAAMQREIDNLKKTPTTPTDEVFAELSKHIIFDVDKIDLKPEFYPVLDQIASELIKSKINVTVVGHTDMTGTYDYNARLSVNRAAAVTNYLVSKGVNRSQLTIRGEGFAQPFTDNDTLEGRQQNRRVEFIKR